MAKLKIEMLLHTIKLSSWDSNGNVSREYLYFEYAIRPKAKEQNIGRH